MSAVRWPPAPAGGRPAPVRVENLALVPASLLAYKATYQRLANQLPAGAVLVVLPTDDTAEKHTLQTAATRLVAKGHPVTTLSVDELLALIPRRRPAAVAVPAAAQPLVVSAASGAAPVLAAVTPSLPAQPDPAVPDVPAFTRELRLVSIDASRNRARFYVLQWQPTLWGGVALLRVWGRLGGRGRTQVVLEAAAPRLDTALTRLVRQRLRHGYQVVDWH